MWRYVPSEALVADRAPDLGDKHVTTGKGTNYDGRKSVRPVCFECLWGNEQHPDMNTGWDKSPENALPYDLL